MANQTPTATGEDELRDLHMKLLSLDKESKDRQATASRGHEIKTAPLFSYQVKAVIENSANAEVFPQYCLLAGDLSESGMDSIKTGTSEQGAPESTTPDPATKAGSSALENSRKEDVKPVTADSTMTTKTLVEENSSQEGSGEQAMKPPIKAEIPEQDPRIFLNVHTPWSAFVCGSQGSGKSYTMSCMLEACLHRTPELGNLLPNPLAGLVFHYDKHLGIAGSVCEAAHLCSAGIPVTVLVPESRKGHMRTLYEGMNVPSDRLPKVKVLKFKSQHINLERMMSSMCVPTEGKKPLYIETITNILREMATESSARGEVEGVDYETFLEKLQEVKLTNEQKGPLNLRLTLFESFLENGKNFTAIRKKVTPLPTDGEKEPAYLWTPQPGALTIVDLSCPFVDESSACTLFSICLSLFLEHNSTVDPQQAPAPEEKKEKGKSGESSIGKVVALDEAHKYMTSTPGSETFTDSLLDTIRMQRHHGIRVIIATQEPTISPRLMDLCSMTLVHRFISRQWMASLKGHLAGVEVATEEAMFKKIVRLGTGEALLFCPTALLKTEKDKYLNDLLGDKMGDGWKHVRVRKRVTDDGGGSRMGGG